MKLISALVGLSALGGIALATAPASAMPIAVPGRVSQASNVEQVNYVCNEWGHCWHQHYYGGGYYHPSYYGGWHHWRPYKGDRIRIGGVPMTTRLLAMQQVARYPLGAHVDVYHHSFAPLIFSAIFAVAGGGMLAFFVKVGFDH